MHCVRHELDYAPFDADGKGLNCPICEIESAALEVIELLAGEQEAESVIDASFSLPGLGYKINRLRKALNKAVKEQA